MKRRLAFWVVQALVLTACMAVTRARAQTQPASAAVQPRTTAKFEGSIVVTSKGQRVTLDVRVQTLIIPNQTKVSVPLAGDAIVHVRAGELRAVVDGKESKQTTDSSFSVVRGGSFVIETGRDSVVVQIVELSAPNGPGIEP